MQRSQVTLQSNPSAYTACLKAVCNAMIQGQQNDAKYKGQLACLVSNSVQQIVGAEFVARVTGELVELPLHQIVGLMQDEAQFRSLVD